MSIYDEANDAFERGEIEGVKEILAPNASSGDSEAQAALGSFLTLSPDPDRFAEYAGMVFDWHVPAFTMAISLAATVMFGLAPALHCAKTDVLAALKDGEATAPVKRSLARLP